MAATRLPVPGIFQARTLEWVAISFSNAWKWKVKVKSLSHVWLLATPWTAAHQAPLSMGVSRQEYWSGVPLPSLIPGDSCCLSSPPWKSTEARFFSQSFWRGWGQAHDLNLARRTLAPGTLGLGQMKLRCWGRHICWHAGVFWCPILLHRGCSVKESVHS